MLIAALETVVQIGSATAGIASDETGRGGGAAKFGFCRSAGKRRDKTTKPDTGRV